MENIHLSSDEEEELILDEGSVQPGDVGADLCLVGRFLTDQPINFNLMRSHMASIWRPGKGVYMKSIGDGRFLFQFFHALDIQRIEEGGPWSFNNIPLILHRLQRGEFPTRVPLNKLSFWVQIHDLPAGYITEGIGKQLGSFIGEFIEYDASNMGAIWKQYMRIRVRIDVTKPLRRGKKIKKPDGTSFTVAFRYERLHVFCFVCGRVGHSERFCEDLFSMESENIKREWGVWLRAEDRRSLSLSGDKWLRNEGDAATGRGKKPVGDPSRKGEPVEMRERRGGDVFCFGNPAYQAESRSEGQRICRDMEVVTEHDLVKDHGSGYNTADFMQKENDHINLGDEMKKRRSDGTPKTGPLSDLSNSPLMLDFQPNNEHGSSSFLSAGPGDGVSRDQ